MATIKGAKRIFTASLKGVPGFAKQCGLLKAEVPRLMGEANQQTADEIFNEARRLIKVNDSYATGELYDSIVVTVTARGLAIYVSSTSHYAPYVEYGTRPHFPPLDAIRRWCAAKGIPESAAYPIAKKISEVGTEAQPFLWPSFVLGRSNHIARIQQIMSAGMRALGRTA